MEFKWNNKNGWLEIESRGCCECGGEIDYLTPEELEELLAERPKERLSYFASAQD